MTAPDADLQAENARLRDALTPFALLITEEGRAPFKADSYDPSTNYGTSFDNSPDDALIFLRLRVGDIRRAALNAPDKQEK